MNMILSENPKTDIARPPTKGIKKYIYNFVSSGKFETFIMICILLNIASMAMGFEGSSA